MRAHRLLPFICAVALSVSSLFAGGLEKYRNWPSSPQGYFMTSAERAEWKASVKTDADAEQFVAKFLAGRKAGFADEVAKRAAIADQRLSVAGRAGSLTTRGKIVILLGPPSSFSMANREVKGSRTSAISAINSTPDLGDGRGQSVGSMVDAANREGMTTTSVPVYTFTYAADRVPGKPGKNLIVEVEANPVDGTDKINDRKVAAQLDQIFEQVAAAQLASAAPAPKP